MPEIDKPLARVIDAYVDAVRDKDVDALMRLYEPGVRVFDTWGVWSYEGADAWRIAVEGWLGSLGSDRVKVRFDEVEAVSTGPVAMLSAIVTYASVNAAGEPVRAMQNRLSWALRTSGHVLRIFHEHTSAPVGFEDTKAILQRSAG